jgi:nucleoside 2-deoxyribosyltransferase
MAKLVYIAGPLFSEAERTFLECILNTLAKNSTLDPLTDFFLPHRDGRELGTKPKHKEIFELDLRYLRSAKIVVALLDGQDVDSGTCIELGYAYAKGKKIFGLLTDSRANSACNSESHRPNIMVWGICEEGKTIFQDVNSLSKAFAEYIGKHPY